MADNNNTTYSGEIIMGNDILNEDEKSQITINKLLALYPKLGIPHFQRGIVWDDQDMSALLESLFYDTPTGLFVLWKTDDQNLGIPLVGGNNYQYLIVDGQQRINCIYSLLKEYASDQEEKEWCINLSKIAKLKYNRSHLQNPVRSDFLSDGG